MKSLKKNLGRSYSWINQSLIVKDMLKYGKGVFASETIKKDTFLIVFGGYILTRKEEEKLPPEIRDIAIRVEKDFVLGIINKSQLGTVDCYVNHSCDPNAGIKGQITLVAMRDIKKGEEITFDYGTVLYHTNDEPEYEFKCLCGNKNCRGKITQYDWMLPKLQEKYKEYFPYYILEEITKLKKQK